MDEHAKKCLTIPPLDSRRREIWSPIAKEFGVTWQSVDAMHWALGQKEMTRRAYQLRSYSEQPEKPEDIVETKLESSHNALDAQQSEEYRVHHFNATRPPQVHLPMPVTPHLVEPTSRLATLSKVSNVDLERSVSSSIGKNGGANLTVEGKRQVSPRVLL